MKRNPFRDVTRAQAREDKGRVFSRELESGNVAWYAELFGIRIRRRTEEGAKATLALLEAKFQGLTERMPEEALDGPNVKLSRVGSRWFKIARRQWNPITTGEQRKILKDLLESFGNPKVFTINPTRIEKWLSAMNRKGTGPSAQLKRFKMLKSLMKRALQEKLIHDDPTKYVKAPKYRPQVAKPYTPEEVEALIVNCKRMRNTRRIVIVRTVIMTMFHLGLRPGEVRALRWEDIDMKQGVIRVRRASRKSVILNKWSEDAITATKNGASQRDLKMTPVLHEQYRKLGKLTTTAGYCFTDTHSPLSHKQFIKDWQTAHNMARVPVRRAHVARHTCASMAVASGASVADVSRLLGHANPNVTAKVYTHSMDPTKQRVAGILAQAYGELSVDD